MCNELAFPPTQEMVNAFPGREYQSREWWPGMTLRDYFAAKALAALITKFPLFDRDGVHGIPVQQEEIDQAYADLSCSAYWYADAMMKERSKVE